MIYKLTPYIVDNFHMDTITITIQLDGSNYHNIEDGMDVKKEITNTNLTLWLTNKPPKNLFLCVITWVLYKYLRYSTQEIL